jgi:hypothetical protein
LNRTGSLEGPLLLAQPGRYQRNGSHEPVTWILEAAE